MSDKSELLRFLSQVLPSERIITDTNLTEKYNSDRTKGFSGSAGIVVLPENAEEISLVLSKCNEMNEPVYTRGGGTGVTGAAPPLDMGLVLSMERMNNILEIDTRNLTATVEPNVITGVLQTEVEKLGLFYPPDPASLDECTLGGNVSQNAGGPRAVKYGVTKDYVLGMECVLPDGSFIHSGGKFVKNSTGYNLTQLITGSEGTLCVMTKLFIKLLPKPVMEYDLLIGFSSLESAIDTVAAILFKRVVPSTIEFMEDEAIRLVSSYRGGDIPFADAKAHLIVKLDGRNQDEIEYQLEILKSLPEIDETKMMIARTKEESEQVWQIRRSVRDSLNHFSPVFFAEDCVVPRSEIPSFIKSIKSQLNMYKVNSVLFGHAGDGNVHIDVLKYDMDDAKFKDLKDRIRNMLYNEAISHGGQITGEHGIGYTRREFLERAVGKYEYSLMKQIKHVFDPNNILNRGKLFF
jgi:glycolate oxidase